MASVTREPTSNPQTQNIISPPHPSNPRLSPEERVSSRHPKSLTSGSSDILGPPREIKKNTLRLVPPPLTGAAALRDEEQLRELQPGEERALQSPNPAMTAVNELRAGPNGALSKAGDAPPRVTTTPAPGNNVTSTATVAEPMQIDQQPMTSPTSMTGSDNHSQTTQPSSSHSLQPPSGSHTRSENKALTYPPQQPQPLGTTGPARGMTLPGSRPVKKHKCQHCDTEFTRHHNLKSHLLTHSQEKPFSCQECHAKFRRLHDLKRHSKLHTGEKPHLCNKCGRKFARGDALARHSKGPGGCAGRRSSVGDDEYYEGVSNPDESMDIDEDPSPDAQRRKSEPNHHYRKPSLQVTPDNSTSSTRLHSSTFPGVAAMSRGASTSTGDAAPSTHLSPRIATASSHGSSPHHLPSSGFGHGGMTESPGPLSPGQVESRRLSSSQAMSYSRERSPSLSHQAHSQGWNSSHQAPPINLPPQNSQPPQLPPISGLTSDHRQPSLSTSSIGRDGISAVRQPPLVNTQHHVHGSGSTGSTNPPSASSSHRHSSGSSSIRDIFNSSGPHAPANISSDTVLVEQNRRLDAELREIKAHMAHYEGIIAQLQEENARLKGQQQQQHPPPQRSETMHMTQPEDGPSHR